MPFRGDRLREARERKGLTQRELAVLADTNETQLSRYEHDKIEPSLKTLDAIVKHLDVSTDFLLGLSDKPTWRYWDREVQDEEIIVLETFRREGWPGLFRLGADRIAR